MSDSVRDQYGTGLSRQSIEAALLAADRDLERLSAADLGMLEDFHTMGRIATAQLVDLLPITSASRVLDAGSGVGGTARYLAERFGCTVVAVDLTGFEIEHWNDLTELSSAVMTALLAQPPLPLGLQTFVPDFERKARHLAAGLADGRLRAIQGVAIAV